MVYFLESLDYMLELVCFEHCNTRLIGCLIVFFSFSFSFSSSLTFFLLYSVYD